MTTALSTALVLALPALGAIAIELIRIIGTRLQQDFNPAIATLRPYFAVIDGAMAAAPPELRDRIRANPVAMVVTELLAERDQNLTTDQVSAAIAWASKTFDFTVHENFNPAILDPAQAAMASRVLSRLGDRLLN